MIRHLVVALAVLIAATPAQPHPPAPSPVPCGGVSLTLVNGSTFSARGAGARLGFNLQADGAAPPPSIAGSRRGASFAFGMAPSWPWAMDAWSADTADVATQGELIAQKLLAYGPHMQAAHAALAMLNIAVNTNSTDTSVWPPYNPHSTLNVEFHQGHQGSLEGAGELLMYARHYAAHFAADPAPRFAAPERLVCAVLADSGRQRLVSGAHSPAVGDSVCAASPAQLLANTSLGLLPDRAKAPYPSVLLNHGKQLAQTLRLQAAVSALLLPLDFLHLPDLWPFDVAVRSTATHAVLASRRVFSAPTPAGAWVQLNATLPPGEYRLELTPVAPPAPTPNRLDPAGSFFYSPGWVTDPAPAVPGGAGYRTYAEQPATNASDASAYTSAALSARLALVLEGMMQGLRRADGSLGLFVVRDYRFRGAPEEGVLSACSYYDLLGMGYKSSYFSLRMLEGLGAYAELAAAGLVPASAQLSAAVAGLRKDIVRQLVDATSGRLAAWAGCVAASAQPSCSSPTAASTRCSFGTSPAPAMAGCNDALPPAADTSGNQTVVEYGFLPAYALAVQLGVDTADGAVAAEFRRLRDAARVAPGLFRVNTRPLESVSPRYWTSFTKWQLRDADGFALRSPNQTGDWQMFRCAASDGKDADTPCDGYGNFPNQAENGGFGLLGTSAFVYRAGAYAAMVEDFVGFSQLMDDVFAQVDANDTSTPLLSNARQALALPVRDALVQQLCQNARHSWIPPVNTSTDAWGDLLCAYYNNVQYPLPENGALFVAVLQGLLGLRVNVNGTLSVGGQASAVLSEHPHGRVDGVVVAAGESGYPPDLRQIDVRFLRVRGQRFRLLCDVDRPSSAPSSSTARVSCQWSPEEAEV